MYIVTIDSKNWQRKNIVIKELAKNREIGKLFEQMLFRRQKQKILKKFSCRIFSQKWGLYTRGYTKMLSALPQLLRTTSTIVEEYLFFYLPHHVFASNLAQSHALAPCNWSQLGKLKKMCPDYLQSFWGLTKGSNTLNEAVYAVLYERGVCLNRINNSA